MHPLGRLPLWGQQPGGWGVLEHTEQTGGTENVLQTLFAWKSCSPKLNVKSFRLYN